MLRFDDLGKSATTVEDIQVFYDGHSVHEEVLSAVKEGELYLLNRHAQIVEDSKIVLKVTLKTQNEATTRKCRYRSDGRCSGWPDNVASPRSSSDRSNVSKPVAVGTIKRRYSGSGSRGWAQS